MANQLFASENSENSQKLNFKKRVLYRQKLLKDFGKRWETEYLLGLRGSQRIPKTNTFRMPNVGDVVLVHGDTPRLSWKLGRIEKLHSSDDGVVRSASLRVGSKKALIKRPIKVLYPLEENLDKKVDLNQLEEDQPKDQTDHPDDIDKVETETSVAESSDDPSTILRPRRAAAIKGEKRRKKIDDEQAVDNDIGY